MKKLLIPTLALVTACAAVAPVLIPTEGAMMRQVTRTVERHDMYVGKDNTLTDAMRQKFYGEAEGVRQLMMSMPGGIPAATLEPALSPVLARHDAYVVADLALDPLERDTFLATTRGIRSILNDGLPQK